MQIDFDLFSQKCMPRMSEAINISVMTRGRNAPVMYR
jgi:hypothetical protein